LAEKFYYTYVVAAGWTNGGAGDIMGSPDDQSAHQLQQSLVLLAEATRREDHVAWAVDAAFAVWSPWQMTYDYTMNGPYRNTSWGRLRWPGDAFPTSGQPLASPQNREPTPGRCVGSGFDLFRLWRLSRDEALLDMVVPMVHNQISFLSDPSFVLPQTEGIGAISERIPVGDAWVHPGEAYPSNWWPSISVILAALDNPGKINYTVLIAEILSDLFPQECWFFAQSYCLIGVYVERDTRRIVVFDHVDAFVAPQSEGATNTGWMLRIRNPTVFDASVCVVVEDSAHLSDMDVNFLDTCHRVQLLAGAIIDMPIA
jgi:hypothetical protein